MTTPENSPSGHQRMDRRVAIKWLLTAASSVAFFNRDSFGSETTAGTGAVSKKTAIGPVTGKGYGQDPDLLRDYKPGDVWPLTFDAHQRATAAALCEVIIPADATSPSAAKLGVHDFIDEWISAPYPGYQEDRETVLNGLAWIDNEAQRRGQKHFVDLSLAEKNALCSDICSVKSAKSEFKDGAHFFKTFRDLTAGGFYTTKEGMKDIGYTGNVPLASFDGPTPAALKHLGLL